MTTSGRPALKYALRRIMPSGKTYEQSTIDCKHRINGLTYGEQSAQFFNKEAKYQQRINSLYV